MACCIAGGKWLPSYKYIGFLIICNVIKDLTFGSHEVEYFEYLKLMDSGDLNNCNFIHEIFCYLLTFIVGIYLYNKESQDISRNSIEYSFKKLENKMTENQTLEIDLIQNAPEVKDFSNIFLFIIIAVWVLNEEGLNYFTSIFIHMDFWMLEIIILTLLMRWFLKLKIYSHQIFMLVLIFIPLILKVITIVFSFLDDGNYGETNFQYRSFSNKLKIIYVAIPKYFTWLILYLALLSIKCLINTTIKWLIDLKNIPWKKILCIYGFLGTVFCLIISLVGTFFSCGETETAENFKDFSEYFCKVKFNNHKYLESFRTYFLSDLSISKIFMEILTVIGGAIAFVGYKISFLIALEHLTPIHLIFAIPAHYLINKTYLIILNIIKAGEPIIDSKYFPLKIILDFLSDGFSVLGYLIYLEVLELKCCNFDYNIRRKILARGIIDLYKADPNNSSNSGNDNPQRTGSEGQVSNSSLNDSYF
jgi:hypothetical protein